MFDQDRVAPTTVRELDVRALVLRHGSVGDYHAREG